MSTFGKSMLLSSKQSLFDFKHSLRLSESIGRNELFAGLCVIGFANGVVTRIIEGFGSRNWLEFLFNTFDISIVLWAALIAGVALLSRAPKVPANRFDILAAGLASAAFLVPVAPLSWIALTGLAFYLVLTSPAQSPVRRAGWILAAMTIPMFWSRIVFALFSETILEFDATLVGWIVGTERTGNAIEFIDGSGYLWIAPSCSSLANVSVAILCSVLFAQWYQSERSSRQMTWAMLACLAVIAINVIRLSLLGMYSQYFDILHGPVGTTVANWLTLAAIIGICALGIRHDLAAQR
jgi:exosortase/archaeosortase family protein